MRQVESLIPLSIGLFDQPATNSRISKSVFVAHYAACSSMNWRLYLGATLVNVIPAPGQLARGT
jgi:hypothetical protein